MFSSQQSAMINFYFAGFVKFVLAFILAVLLAGAKPVAAHTFMLNRGDQLNGMRLVIEGRGAC
jgi:hypothetical protein